MSRRRVVKKKPSELKLISGESLTLEKIKTIPNIFKDKVLHNRALFVEENICNDNIYFITQFFLHSNFQRREEIIYCLKKNCQIFQKIFLINERNYSIEELGLTEEEFKKVDQVVTGKRITYKCFLDFCNNRDLKGYFILSNADIFLDKTVNNLRKGFLSFEKSVYVITRHEINRKGKISEDYMWDCCQDTWIIHSNYLFKNTSNFNFSLGKLRCDNRVAYLFFNLGFKIYNCPYSIKTFHFHESQIRDYTYQDMVPGSILSVQPLESITIKLKSEKNKC